MIRFSNISGGTAGVRAEMITAVGWTFQEEGIWHRMAELYL
jgi:hypothetical protein